MEGYSERRPLLTSQQIGLAAAFGGAGFAFRALGLAIPLVPPLVMDPGALMPILAGMAGGPIVGAIVGVARGIPSGTPAVDLWAQPIKGIYWAFVWKYLLLKIEDERKRWIAFAAVSYTHLECGASITKTAQSLFIHENTLRYRLKKIEKVSGLDLKDSKNCFKLALALHILPFLKD